MPLDTATPKGEAHAMTWITIARQQVAGARWEATDPAKSIEWYKHKYDAGEGEMAQRKNRKLGGFDLLYQQNKPPHKQRGNHERWFRIKETESFHRANGGRRKGISKYE
tara:strand:+ start:170 stop:496 length:327 start_codon:yes stop_codon:yes gene_type:complete